MSKYWVGTSFQIPFIVPPGLEYAVYQTEKCPHTGKDHIQFFVVFPQRKRLSAAKQILPAGAHLEIARNVEKSRAYCMKEMTRLPGTTYTEVGQWSQGGSSLLQKLKRPLKDLAEEFPWKIRQIKDLKAIQAKKRDFQTQCVLLTGLTGTGKSRIAERIGSYLGEDHVYWADPNLQWFDHYDQEELMVVDEFRGVPKVDTILRLADRYPYKLPFKGGFVEMGSKMIILTSNLELDVMYGGLDKATRDAITRRVKTYTVY